MPKCDQCGMEVILPFTCAYCGKHYCVEHRLPESHHCSNAPKNPPSYLAPIIIKDEGQKSKTHATRKQKPKAKARDFRHINRSSLNILGLCPQCNHISENIVNYDASTITFQCVRCGLEFSQLKATHHDYVETPEPQNLTKETTYSTKAIGLRIGYLSTALSQKSLFRFLRLAHNDHCEISLRT